MFWSIPPRNSINAPQSTFLRFEKKMYTPYLCSVHSKKKLSSFCYHRIYLRKEISLSKMGPAWRSLHCWGWPLTPGTVCITLWSLRRSSSCPWWSSSSAMSGYTPSCQCEYEICRKQLSRCTAIYAQHVKYNPTQLLCWVRGNFNLYLKALLP